MYLTRVERPCRAVKQCTELSSSIAGGIRAQHSSLMILGLLTSPGLYYSQPCVLVQRLTDELAPSFGVFIDCRNDTTSDQRTGGLPLVCTDEHRPPGHTGYMHKGFAPSATHTLFDCKYCLVKKQDKARYSNIPLQYLLAALAHPGCLPPFSTLQLIVVLIHFSTSFNSIYQAQRPALSKSLPFGTSWRRISKSTTA